MSGQGEHPKHHNKQSDFPAAKDMRRMGGGGGGEGA